MMGCDGFLHVNDRLTLLAIMNSSPVSRLGFSFVRLQKIRMMLAFRPAKLLERGRFGNNLATALAISAQCRCNVPG
jgi:hypothetical protein